MVGTGEKKEVIMELQADLILTLLYNIAGG